MKGKKVILNEEQVFELASRFWTKVEIAAFYNIHPDTITKNYQAVYEKGRESGKGKLRDLQLKSAINGNVTMQIWLGKQYLSQSEKIETRESGEIKIRYSDYEYNLNRQAEATSTADGNKDAKKKE